MSLNLVFFNKQTSDVIEFPYQTPTDVTTQVFDAKTTKERIALIKKDVYDNMVDIDDVDSIEYADTLILEIKNKLRDPNIILGIA